MAVSRDFRALLLSRRCGALSVHNIIQKTRTMAPKKKSPPKTAAALPSRRSSRSASLTGMDALDATATPAAPKSRARGASAAGLASRSSSRSRCKTSKVLNDNDEASGAASAADADIAINGRDSVVSPALGAAVASAVAAED